MLFSLHFFLLQLPNHVLVAHASKVKGPGDVTYKPFSVFDPHGEFYDEFFVRSYDLF